MIDKINQMSVSKRIFFKCVDIMVFSFVICLFFSCDKKDVVQDSNENNIMLKYGLVRVDGNIKCDKRFDSFKDLELYLSKLERSSHLKNQKAEVSFIRNGNLRLKEGNIENALKLTGTIFIDDYDRKTDMNILVTCYYSNGRLFGPKQIMTQSGIKSDVFTIENLEYTNLVGGTIKITARTTQTMYYIVKEFNLTNTTVTDWETIVSKDKVICSYISHGGLY